MPPIAKPLPDYVTQSADKKQVQCQRCHLYRGSWISARSLKGHLKSASHAKAVEHWECARIAQAHIERQQRENRIQREKRSQAAAAAAAAHRDRNRKRSNSKQTGTVKRNKFHTCTGASGSASLSNAKMKEAEAAAEQEIWERFFQGTELEFSAGTDDAAIERQRIIEAMNNWDSDGEELGLGDENLVAELLGECT